jgi:mRNA interferase RelE/StbE
MKWTVEFTPGSETDLLRLQTVSRLRVARAIAKLEDDPFPTGREKMKGHVNLWRIRVGDFRVVYAVDESRRSLTITRIRDRKEVYRDL